MADSDPKRELLRHALATLAYRAAKTIRTAPDNFAAFNDAGRTPANILAHMGDLMDWSLSMADGSRKWNDSTPSPWPEEAKRFFAALQKFDDYLASDNPLQCSIEKLLQGPIADALTHVGQLAMLRRLAGASIAMENYFVAEVVVGRVGPEQTEPKRRS
jgi:hypothetical protein